MRSWRRRWAISSWRMDLRTGCAIDGGMSGRLDFQHEITGVDGVDDGAGDVVAQDAGGGVVEACLAEGLFDVDVAAEEKVGPAMSAAVKTRALPAFPAAAPKALKSVLGVPIATLLPSPERAIAYS